MSRYAWLACPDQRLMIWLGKMVGDTEGIVRYFRIGDAPAPPNSANHRLNRAVWKFLAETSGHDLCVITDVHPEYQRLEEYREIGGHEIGDIPFDEYLAEWSEGPSVTSGDLDNGPSDEE
jgi:hypothetical protein